MAHLWIKGTEGWGARILGASAYELAEASCRPAPDNSSPHPGGARLMSVNGGGPAEWALITANHSSIRVNSRTLPAGLRVLEDRDQIRIGAETSYFSSEALPVVEPFPGADRAVRCGRCRQDIEVGSPAIRCPGCQVWHHQGNDLPCFTYAEKCTFCGHATALDAGFQWVPEED